MPNRLDLDEDSCDIRLIVALRKLGVDVLSADEAGKRWVSDVVQFEFAFEQNRTIVTANYKDFVPLQADWGRIGREHEGVIIWTQSRFSQESLASKLAEICETRSEAQLRNALIWL